MTAGNGHDWGQISTDVARINQRLDEQELVNQRRAADLEDAEINLEKHFGSLKADVQGFGREVNQLRHNLNNRLELIEKRAVHTSQMLALLLSAQGIEIPKAPT